MRHFSIATLLMFLTGSVVAQQVQQQPYWARPRNGNEGLILTGQQIAADSQKALNGDGNAAAELGAYYSVVGGDQAKGEYWYRISAENADPGGQRSYGNLLLQSSKEEDRARAIFWFEKAASGGDSLAKDTLKRLGH
jgi:TPR repeat protein